MKFAYFLLGTISLSTFAGIIVPVKVPQGEHRTMAEDFPLSLHVDYGSHDRIDHPTSVAVNFPLIEVLQRHQAYGAIDASESQLPYSPLDINNHLLGALDFNHDGNGAYWYVDGSRTIYFLNTQNGIARNWQLWGHFNFSEIATSPDSDYVWAYDACRGDLLRIPKLSPWCFTRFKFDRPMDITGLTVDETSVYVLDIALGSHVIYQFEIGNLALDYVSSWEVLGFDDDLITDLSLVPDGSFLIATTDPELSLVLIEDKEKELVSPIDNTDELAVLDQINFPQNVTQPSGIWRDSQGHWFFTTDQAEVFELDESFQNIGQFDAQFESVACNQGCTEAITGKDNDLFVLTDFGFVARYERGADSYQYRQEFELNYKGRDGEPLTFSGLTHRPDTNTFFLMSDGEDDQEDFLLEVDENFIEISRHSLSYQGQVEGSIYNYDAAGIQYYNGKIYALSYAYNDLLEISLEGEILRTFGVDRELLREPSDMFIWNDLIYMVGDHENNEPTPPMIVFTLPQ